MQGLRMQVLPLEEDMLEKKTLLWQAMKQGMWELKRLGQTTELNPNTWGSRKQVPKMLELNPNTWGSRKQVPKMLSSEVRMAGMWVPQSW
jgi:hypothetical protein